MKDRFGVLDIFRGLFASLVFGFHLSPFADTPVLANPLILNSDLFVDFFFVLSGFVISYSYPSIDSRQQAFLFLKKRFLRIYPLHLILLLAFLGIELSKAFLSEYVHVNQPDNPANTGYSFLASLLLLNSTPIFNPVDVSWNIQSWSISAEMIAYCAFALTVFLLSVSGRLKQLPLIAISVAVGSYLLLSAQHKGGELTYSFDYGFLRGLTGFFCGVISTSVYQLISAQGRRRSDRFFSLLEIGMLTLIFFLIGEGTLLKPFGWMYELLFMAAILVFAFEKGIVSGFLKRIPILKRVGEYSYSIYMTHTLLISLFNIVFIRILKFSPADYSYLFVFNYLLVYAVSSWTYHHIERRFQYKPVSSQKTSKMV